MSELRWILLIAGVVLIVALYLFGSRNRQRNPAELDRPLRVDPPRPPPVAETSRLEPRISLADAETLDALDPSDEDDDAPPAPLSPPPRREPGAVLRPEARIEPPTAAGAPIRPEPGLRAESTLRPGIAARDTAALREGNARREEAPTRSEQRPAAPASRGPQKIVAIRVTAAHPSRFDGALLREVVTAARFTHGRYEIFHRLDADGRPIMSLASLIEPGTFDPSKMDMAAYPGIALFTVMPGPLPAARAFDELLDTARALANRLGGQLQDDRGAPLSVQRVFKLREEVVAFERTLGAAGGA
jgi:cell division protein ZipA